MAVPRPTGPMVDPSPASQQRMNVRPTAEAAGAGLAQGLGQAADVSLQIYEREREKADELALISADRRLAEWEASTIFDEQSGLLRRRGRDALGAPDEAMRSFAKLQREIERGLVGDRQLLAFERLSNRRREGAQRTLQQHVAREIESYRTEEANASLALSVRNAGNKWRDPAQIAEELSTQEDIINSLADAIGMSPERRQQMLAEVREASHLSVITRMVDEKEPTLAKFYYDSNKDDLGPEAKSRAEKMIEAADQRRKIHEWEDDIMRRFAGDRGAALAEARKAPPEIRSEVVSAVQARFEDSERTRAFEGVQRARQADQYLRDSGGDMDSIPASLLSQMDTAELRDLKVMSNYIRSGMPERDDGKWVDIFEMMRLDPEGFMEQDLRGSKWRPYLDDRQFDFILDAQTQMKSALSDPTKSGNMTTTLSFSQQLENAARRAGLINVKDPITSLNRTQRKLWADLVDYSIGELRTREAEITGGKRKLTDVEVRDLVNDIMLREVYVEGGRFFGLVPRQMHVAQVTQDQRGRMFLPLSAIQDEIGEQGMTNVRNVIAQRAFGYSSFSSMPVARKPEVNDHLQRLWAFVAVRDDAAVEEYLQALGLTRKDLTDLIVGGEQ